RLEQAKPFRPDHLIDAARSYSGLRSVTLDGKAVKLNRKTLFQRLVLDQGYYPDGIMTAPSDAALKHDIELSMAAGFNGARLHQKVFEPRFLYWADRLGYLVWGEFPNWGMDYARKEACLTFVDEWTEIVNRDRNHPSIIGWCPFNETPHTASPLQKTVYHITRSLDPTRPVLETSGWVHSLADPQLLDAHDYNQNPTSFRTVYGTDSDLQVPERYGVSMARRDRPFFISEFGGIGWNLQDGWGYGSSPKTEEEFYTRYEGLTNVLLDNRGMFGFCYTQLTDVEQEQNGLYRYDRTPKFDAKRIQRITSRRARYEEDPPLNTTPSDVEWCVLVGAAVDGDRAQTWRYQMETQPKEGWETVDYDDSSWQESKGGFGDKGGWESRTGTTWKGKDIWLRGQFEHDGSSFDRAVFVTHYDNATEIYVNGELIWEGEGWNDAYAPFEITDTLKRALKRGTNTIAVHCHQDTGGQFIDLAVLVTK
ncbi:MAG TPA: glycoside hydrolase family 2 TIM barrel-domain containing protein, partial [bacterium]|nr:glycoside hydrolase family 2 TIM barrel-domain containing protein [bacterium]